MTSKKNTSPLESWEQAQIFRWAFVNQLKHPELQLLNGSLNGVRLRPTQWRQVKRQGTRKGYPDINLPVPRRGYHGLYIELKRTVGGKLDPAQKWWAHQLNQHGYMAVVCYGHGEALDTIEWYLNINTLRHTIDTLSINN